MSSRTIFVGNLPGDVRRREVEDLFSKYGRIREVDLKLPPRPPGFAFIEYDDPRDAEDAVRGRDGYDFGGGFRLRVELAHGGGRRGGGGMPPPRGGGSDRGGGRMGGGGYGGGMGGGVSRRTGYRVMVTGLPKSASWQDLKDHMRKAGDVTFAQVFRDRSGMMGIVDYSSKDDMRYALRKLDDTEFRNPFDRAYIRVKEDKTSRSRSRSRGSASRSRSRSRSRSASSRSHSRSRGSRSVSRSASRSKSRSKSHSRSKSRSPARSGSAEPNGKARSTSPVADKGDAGSSPIADGADKNGSAEADKDEAVPIAED